MAVTRENADKRFRQGWNRFFIKNTDDGMKYYICRFNHLVSSQTDVAYGIFGYENANTTSRKLGIEELAQARLDHGYSEVTCDEFQVYIAKYHRINKFAPNPDDIEHIPAFEFDSDAAASFRARLMQM